MPHRPSATALLLAVPFLALGASLWWGLPCDARKPFLFHEAAAQDGFLEAVAGDTRRVLETKDTLRIAEADAGQELAGQARVRALRRMLLFSEDPDEMHSLAALAAMDPPRRLDPKDYTYGGIYYYALGAALVAADAVGYADLQPGAGAYLAAPSRMGRLYVAGRALNLLFLALLVWSVRGALRSLGLDRPAANRGATLAGLLPGVLIWGAVLKPHLAGAAFTAAALCFTLRARHGGAHWRRHVLLAAAAAGTGAAFQYTAALALAMPLALLLVARRRGWCRRTGTVLLMAAAQSVLAAGLFLLLNPFLALNWATAQRDMAHTAAMHPMQWPGFRGWAVAAFLLAVAAGPALLAALGLAVAAILHSRRADLRPDRASCWCIGLFLAAALPLAAAATAAEGFQAANARFYLLLLPPLAVLVIGAVPRRPGLHRVLTALAVAGGLYLGAQHLLASRRDRPPLAAAAWIVEHVPRQARIALVGDCAPFRFPPLDLARYRVSVHPPAADGWPPDAWVLSPVALGGGRPLAQAWCAPLPYFRASFADWRLFLYTPATGPTAPGR